MKFRLPALPAVLTREIKLPERWSFYLWKSSAILAGALCLFLVAYFFYFYIEEAEHAVAKGKRVIISITTETVQARLPTPSKEAQKKTAQNVMPVLEETPRIVAVIRGLGLDGEATEAALAMPNDITLSFSPYAENMSAWNAPLAKRKNILLDLPLEPIDYPQQEPGNLALLTQLDHAENTRRLETILGSVQKTGGLLATPREKFTSSLAGMQPVLDALRSQNMILLYEPRESNRVLAEDARKHGVKLLEVIPVLSSNFERSALQSELVMIEATAREKGYAVAVFPAYSGIFEEIKMWLGQFDNKRLKLVPVEAMFAAPEQTAFVSARGDTHE